MIIQTLQNAINSWYEHLGYGGIVLAMALESCLLPLPSEIIMPLAGYFTLTAASSTVHFNLVGVAFAGALGCVLGSAVAYGIGISGGRPFIMKYGKYILISRHDFDIADRWFVRYGSPITFFSRLLPIVRTYISLPAGISEMNFVKFIAYTFLGSLPWCFALAFAGQKLGAHYSDIGATLHKFDYAIGALIVIGLVAYVWRHIRKEREYDAHLSVADGQQNTDSTQKQPRVRK